MVSEPVSTAAVQDEAELAALRRQDRDAFARLVKAHHRALLAVARGIVGIDDAEEVVQKAWLKAYEAIARFEGRSQLRTWLTTIVMNEARSNLRRRRTAPTADALSTDDPYAERFDDKGHWREPPLRWSAEDPESSLMAEQLSQCLAKTLAALPARQRLVFELRDIQQMPIEDIAAQLDTPAGNVRVILHRARGHLYAAIERYEASGQC